MAHRKLRETPKTTQYSTVQLSNGSFITVRAMFAIRTEVDDELHIITGNILQPINYDICKTNSPILSSSKFFIIASITTQIVAISPDMLCTKCIKIPFECQQSNHCCIVRLVNDIERD